jgi:hypothetical protein
MRSGSDAPRLDHRESRRELLAYAIYRIDRGRDYRASRSRGKSKEDHAGAAKAFSINKFTEIGVLGEQDALFISRERQNLFISILGEISAMAKTS